MNLVTFGGCDCASQSELEGSTLLVEEKKKKSGVGCDALGDEGGGKKEQF